MLVVYKQQLRRLMKAICVSLLVVLAFQLQLSEDTIRSPFANKQFVITYNSLGEETFNGLDVIFSQDTINFQLCHYNPGTYTLGRARSIKVDSFWANTYNPCPNDKDPELRQLFTDSASYELRNGGRKLTFKNEQGEKLLVLREKKYEEKQY